MTNTYELLKFRSFSGDPDDPESNFSRTLDIIENKRVWFGAPHTFNDPFDMQIVPRINFSKDELKVELSKYLKDENSINTQVSKWFDSKSRDGFKCFLSKLSKKIYVYCAAKGVASEPSRVLMWGHYGDNHKGVMLKFLINQKCELHDEKSIIYPVHYLESENLPELGSANDVAKFINNDSLPLLDSFMVAMTTKYSDWRYEHEYRIMHNVENKNEFGLSGILINLSEINMIIDAIYFGFKSKKERNTSLLIDAVKNICQKTKIFQGKRSETEYKIEFEQIH